MLIVFDAALSILGVMVVQKRQPVTIESIDVALEFHSFPVVGVVVLLGSVLSHNGYVTDDLIRCQRQSELTPVCFCFVHGNTSYGIR